MWIYPCANTRQFGSMFCNFIKNSFKCTMSYIPHNNIPVNVQNFITLSIETFKKIDMKKGTWKYMSARLV